MTTRGGHYSRLIHRSIPTRQLIRLKAGYRYQGLLLWRRAIRGAARRQQGLLRAGRKRQGLHIFRGAARRRLGRLRAGRKRQGLHIFRGAARRRLGRLRAGRKRQGLHIFRGAARRRLGWLRAGRKRQGWQICIFSRNHQNYLMNRSRRYSKNFFSYIFVCYRDLPNPAIFLILKDFCYTG
jgi:hypothetical protein